MKRALFRAIFFVLILMNGGILFADECAVTVVHTGDLHSHFEPARNHYNLGGYGRIKTQIDSIRSARGKDNVLVLDAGDWSEGSIYYTLGEGEASLSLLDEIGYDAVALGNHDWFNGPAKLEDILIRVKPKFPLLAANLNFDQYNKEKPTAKLAELILPYKIFHLQGKKIKVAVIGLTTDEYFYSYMFDPVRIDTPIGIARRLVHRLREEGGVDAVILLTHLSDSEDEKIAKTLMGVDLIVGGHSHTVFRKPKRSILRRGGIEWETAIVKVGAHGEYIGEACLKIEKLSQGPYRTAAKVAGYKLHQIDEKIVESKALKERIQAYKKDVAEKFKRVSVNIFEDQVAVSTSDFVRAANAESDLGNLVVDSILDQVKDRVSAAISGSDFIRMDLTKGALSSATIFNLVPSIFKRDRAWTIYTVKVPGEVLQRLILAVLGSGLMFDIAGGELFYDKFNRAQPIVKFELGGKPVLAGETYEIAVNQGLKEALQSAEAIKNIVPEVDQLEFVDSGVEVWQAVRERLKKEGVVHAAKFSVSGRTRSKQADAVIFPYQIALEKTEFRNPVANVTIRNLGMEDAKGRGVIYFDQTPNVAMDNPVLEELSWNIKQDPDDKTQRDPEGFFKIQALPNNIGSYTKIADFSFSGIKPLQSEKLVVNLPPQVLACQSPQCHLTVVLSNVTDSVGKTPEVVLTNNVAACYFNR